jgi:hypothetical protein
VINIETGVSEEVDVLAGEIVFDQKAYILSAITSLEAEITPRRQREALLSIEGKEWLATWDTKIKTLRNELATV